MNDIKLHPGQLRVMESTARFLAAICGAQSGKTTLGAIWLCNEIWKAHTEGRYGDWLIAAPTVKILGQSSLPKFKGFYPADWGPYKEAKQHFELPWTNLETNEPCKIFVRSTDNPEWLEGMTLLGAWLDEAGLMDFAVWVNIQARLSKNKGRALLTTTPYASRWIKREIVARAKSNDPIYAAFTWKSCDNPSFPIEEYERLKRTLPAAIFQRRHEGEFVTMEGLVYPDYDETKHVVAPFDIPAEWRRFGGLDFGHDKPTACVCVAEDPRDHCFYIYQEYYKQSQLLKDIANFLMDHNMQYVLADPQGAQNIAELVSVYRRGEVRAAENKVDIGIERISVLLREGRLKFFRGKCEKLLSEIEEYHYQAPDPDRPDKPDKPVKKNDHALDALKYAFSREIKSVYPAMQQRRGSIKERLASRKFPDADPWSGY